MHGAGKYNVSSPDNWNSKLDLIWRSNGCFSKKKKTPLVSSESKFLLCFEILFHRRSTESFVKCSALWFVSAKVNRKGSKQADFQMGKGQTETYQLEAHPLPRDFLMKLPGDLEILCKTINSQNIQWSAESTSITLKTSTQFPSPLNPSKLVGRDYLC